MPARAWGTMRMVRAATNTANTTSTRRTITPAVTGIPLFAHEGGCAPDLDHRHAGARVDHLVVVIGARGPHLSADLHATRALDVGDALDHGGGLPDQGGGAGP